ncbi:VOC family protein [Roseimicrobium gellanilyticum]|nr:VOC family protein [Roseimicrobium gellanilyticum]
MKQNAINWFEIYTNDINKAADFYEKILKKELSKITNEKYNMAMFPCDLDNGVGGALTQMDKCQPGGGGTVVYLNVEGDLDGVLERIPKHGGTVVQPRLDIAPHGFIGIFKDLEGNVVGLHSMV